MKIIQVSEKETLESTPLELMRLFGNRLLGQLGSAYRVTSFREIPTFGGGHIYEIKLDTEGEKIT